MMCIILATSYRQWGHMLTHTGRLETGLAQKQPVWVKIVLIVYC